ncbi:MAG TPA: nucleoside permease [Bryobacteraceae bacterium]|nr:nucleoside permease [Bryobacteraceae bacterium]
MPIAARLSVMMFLNYVVWGAWYVTLGTYLTQTLHFTGTQSGFVFGTSALSCIISPFFVGLIADRYFAAERVLSALHLIGAVLLVALSRVTTFPAVFALLLAYCICYFPTIALTNSLTLRNITNAATQFPLIRVFATLGWIVIGLMVGYMNLERSATAFLLAAGFSVAMGLYSLTLPHTPPAAKGKSASWRTILGLDALVMLKDRSYLVFVIASVLACIPLTFYFSFTNAYLNEVGVPNAAAKMTLGQASEVIMMLLMPWIFRKFSLKWILTVGLLTWSVRYLLLAYGNAGDWVSLFYLAILVHGICYDFFFMTGQLYTDQEAPAHLRATAQGFIQFLTYGVGMLLGSLLSGVTVDLFSTGSGATVTRNWRGFWTTSAIGAFLIFLLVAAVFRSKGRIQTSKPTPA